MTDNFGGIEARIGNSKVVRLPGGGDHNKINLLLAEKERNDLGNGERFVMRFQDSFLYVNNVGWFCWTRKYWSPIEAEQKVKRKAHETARSILEEVDALQKRGRPDDIASGDWEKWLEDLFKWSMASGNQGRLEAMVKVAKPYMSVEPDKMNRDPLQLNVMNGTLKLKKPHHTFTAHKRGDMLSKIMDVEYNTKAQCPKFHAFLKDVQPDSSVRRFLQVWTGYCLTGDTSEQKLVYNYGQGGNGKSVFINLISKMMNQYAASMPFASLLNNQNKRGSDATPDLARLPGARMVRASEPDKGARFAEAMIKEITGGEEVTVRHLNHDFFDFVPQFKLNLSGNHKPVIKGQDLGIWRRLLLVPWNVNIPDHLADRQLHKKLWAERSGVLNWMLEGVRIWLESGLYVPESIQQATDQYRDDSDHLGRFIKECLEKKEGECVQASVMYNAYCAWCRHNSETAWTMTTFGKTLPERGVERNNGRVRTYKDICLINTEELFDGDLYEKL